MGSGKEMCKETFKSFIAKQLIGKELHFTCDCLVPINIRGEIKDYEILNNEIVFIVDVKGRLVKLGENHPNLMVEYKGEMLKI